MNNETLNKLQECHTEIGEARKYAQISHNPKWVKFFETEVLLHRILIYWEAGNEEL